MPEGVNVPTTTPSTRTRKSWREAWKLARWAALEAQPVGAGRHAGDRLAERAGPLQEADLGALRGVGVAGGEAAAVARHAGPAGERPGSADRAILEAVAHRRRLEPGVGQTGRGGLGQADVVDEGGVVAAGAVQALEGDRVRSGSDREGGGQAGVAGARGREGAHRHAVDQHPEVLARGLEVAPLGGLKLSW